VKQSVIDTFKKHGWRVDRAIHNLIYFYYHKHYVAAARLLTQITVKLFGWFKPARSIPFFVFNRYHSKILSSSDITKILSLEEDINLGKDELKRVIPFDYANRIIFNNPKLIAVMDCPCALNQKDGERCEPLSKCIAIGQDFAPLWLETCEKKYNARQISQAEALDIIKGARKSGHVTNAFLKVATGGMTGIICNCCPKCCVEFAASNLARTFDEKAVQYAESGYSVKYEKEKCDLCGACEKVCPFEAISVREEKLNYDRKACKGCELCVEACPRHALSLYQDPEKLLPLDIDLLKGKLF